ncbi:MAG: hypothetical protein U0L98_07195 [Clostridia bacterium]|nr:hypothetical protein [Clostridia bacterium]
MINTKLYTVLDSEGYTTKDEAYAVIRMCYEEMSGVTTYYDNGLWFIVQSKTLK